MHKRKISLSQILFLFSYTDDMTKSHESWAAINSQSTYELRDRLKRDSFQLDLRYDPPSLGIKFSHCYNYIHVI